MFTAPFAKLDDNITGKRSGVIAIAIATANVNATRVSCLILFIKNATPINININLISNLLTLSIPFSKLVFGFPICIVWATFPKYVLSAIFKTMPFPVPLITFVPIKQIVSISVISSIWLSVLFSEITFFLTASDSPVKDDWTKNKSFASIIFKSAGIKSPAESFITSPIVTWSSGIFSSFPFLITVVLTETIFFSFSAALFDLYTSKNSKKELITIKTSITIMFA